MMPPPKETMQSLRTLISPHLSTSRESEITQLLNLHKVQLLSHIHSTPPSPTDSEILYRSNLLTTRPHPKPTPAEAQWLATHKLPLSKQLAALHLRDYLHDTYPTSAHSLLDSPGLVSYASPQSVLQFAKDEIHAAYDVLTTVFTNSTRMQFSQFLNANRSDIRDAIIKAADAIFSPTKPDSQPDMAAQPPTVFALLLTAAVFDFLSMDDLLHVLNTYITAASSQSHSFRALENDILSNHLLTATITTTIRRNSAQLHSLIDSFRPLLNHKSTLPVLVSLSISVILRLNNPNSVDAAVLQPDPSRGFMDHALSSDALGRLRFLLHQPLNTTDSTSLKRMFRIFTGDLLSFLATFPPTSLEHSQIEDLARLVSGLMERSEMTPIADIANSLWDDGDKPPLAKGVEHILYLSSALYPLSFRPLISLLRVLAVDKRSAAHAVNFLEHRTVTLCETAEGYADALIALDEDQEVVWEKLRNYIHEFRATRALTNVKMGGSMVFLQAMREIPGGTYRGDLPAGAIGISDENFTTVAWMYPWNGFNAVVYALDTLHDMLCSDVPPSADFRAVLEDLVDSAIEALGFVQQVCLNGSDTLRQHLCESFGVAETITRIVAEILQTRGRASFSMEWLQALLKSASSCLPVIVGADANYASRVARILSDAVKRDSFAAIITSFGETAPPVLAAFGYINSILPQRNFYGSNCDPVRDCTCSDEGINVFEEVVTNMLFSWSLPNRGKAVFSESESNARWLLLLWTMRLFQSKPEVLLSSSSASLLFGTTIVSTASRHPLSESGSLLYPAVCEAVIACLNALRHRSKGLSSRRNRLSERLGTSERPKRITDLTALEEVLLRPDIVEAMAMICCGGAKLLQDDKFYFGWTNSKYRYLLPVPEGTKDFQLYDVLRCHTTSNRESRADLWLFDMVAHCLSLQMDCLSHLGTREDIPQVPWPSSSSTHDSDACIGSIVRERIAKRVSDGCSAGLLGFLTAVLSSRQRAASRSLFGPRRSSVSRSDAQSCLPNVSRQNKEDKEQPVDPIPAVIFCLRRTFQCYQELLVAQKSAGSSEKLQFLKRGGKLSTMTATCVRMLRLGLISQNSRWFRDYIQSDFWELLTSLVRCGGGTDGSRSFDLKQTCMDWYTCNNMSSLSKNSGHESYRQLVLNAEHVLDNSSIWKGIAADVFHITSREILAEATEAILTARSEKDESENNYHLRDSLLRRPLFRSFANVFSETWVTALLGTEPVREVACGRDSFSESQDVTHLKGSLTLKGCMRHLSRRIWKTVRGTPSDYDVLSLFDRCGDLSAPYGASYAFDIARLGRFLDSKKVPETLSDDLILAVVDLNMMIGRQDVYVDVVSSFSSMASVVLFVDSLCLSRNLGLSYSSPQFGGKLCRYLPRVLTSLLSGGVLSWHFVAVSLEVSKLLSMLSTRLTKEELEQCALTSMRHGDSLVVPAELHTATPLGHICHVINRIVSTEDTAVWGSEESRSRHQIVSWLLLTASRYTNGSAFHTTADLQSLVRTCVRTLKMLNETYEVCAAVSTALTETIANMPNDLFVASFTNGVLRALLTAVDASANKLKASDQRVYGTAITGLLLTLTRAVIRLRNAGKLNTMLSLRDVNASGVQPLLPTLEKPVETYDLKHDERNVYHALWCSILQLAAVVIPRRLELGNPDVIENDDLRFVVEFCSMHLERIIEDSLDLEKRQSDFSDGSSAHAHLNFHAVTMGKVEEAELGALVLSRLSPFGLVLRNTMPNTTRRALEQLCRYTAQAARILRSDPVERWVRPVTQRERGRSGVAMEQLTSAVGSLHNGQSTPNRSPSPGRRSRSQLTPKRSPSQALRAALSGKPRHGLTPSPGSSLTPLMSPMPNASDIRGKPPCFSPNSPWGDHGSGLITRTGQCFAEEVSMSLIRGLCAALDAIRQLSEHLGIYPFQATMEAIDDVPGIGTLLAILKFACWELNREDDEDRRACVQGIADTAMHLTLSHAMSQAETGALPQSVRDEVRKRVTTTLYRANNLVPPIPTSSILRDEGLMALWKRF